jgi:hypothetical protein
MPVFGLGKQRFHPDLALVHRFLIGQGLMISLHTLQILREKGTMHVPTALAWSTVYFHGASIAGARSRTVLNELCPALLGEKQTALALEGSDTDHGRHHR